MLSTIERAGYHFHTKVEKWDQDQTLWVAERAGIVKPEAAHFEALHVKPFDVIEVEGNQLLDTSPAVGVQDLWKNLIGTYTQAADTTHSGVCVGDSSSAENANQTDLQAATNKWYEDNDSTWPQISGTYSGVDFKSSFGASDGNWAWNEWGIIIPGASAPAAITPASTKPANYTLFNRKVQSLGTKASGTWTLTGTITLT